MSLLSTIDLSGCFVFDSIHTRYEPNHTILTPIDFSPKMSSIRNNDISNSIVINENLRITSLSIDSGSDYEISSEDELVHIGNNNKLHRISGHWKW